MDPSPDHSTGKRRVFDNLEVLRLTAACPPAYSVLCRVSGGVGAVIEAMRPESMVLVDYLDKDCLGAAANRRKFSYVTEHDTDKELWRFILKKRQPARANIDKV